MNSSFPNRWSFSYLKFTKYVTNIIAEPKYKYGEQEQVTVRNHNRSTALERSVLKYWGGGLNWFYGNPISPSASVMAQNTVVRSAWRFFTSSMDHHVETNKSQINTWRSLGCRTTPLEHWSKRRPTVESRWAKQQTKGLRPNQLK